MFTTVQVSCPLVNESATPSNSNTRHEFAPMLMPAPTSRSTLACSYTVTSTPGVFDSAIAVARPPGPAPMTATFSGWRGGSTVIVMCNGSRFL